MKEAYVTYETAKLLKEKGFDWDVFTFFDETSNKFNRANTVYNWNNANFDVNVFSAPTQQMACYWVEKTYGFFIEISRSIDINGNYHYFYMILDKTCKYASSATSDNDYSSKSDAIESALEYVLTKLI